MTGGPIDEMGVSLRVTSAVIDRLVASARDAAPNECCGLLVGRAGCVQEAWPTPNTAEVPSRHFRIDPRDHLAVIRAARMRGLRVIGAYHSHPAGAAIPSAEDAAQAFRDFLFVIIGLGAAEPDVRGWEWGNGNFAPVSLVRTR